MYTLVNWSINAEFDYMYASGIVFNNPKFAAGRTINTSMIMKVKILNKDTIVIETYSGSLYALPINLVNMGNMKNTVRNLKSMGFSDNVFKGLKRGNTKLISSEIEKLLEKAKQQGLEKVESLRDKIKPNELYLETDGTNHVLAYFMRDDKVFVEIPITYHTGMFQDSVLITDFDEGLVDFRFFPNIVMKPYHWSDGLLAVNIKNTDKSDFEFAGSERYIVCKAGEITRIESKEYCGEGLFCPDAVNGKCVFSQDKAFSLTPEEFEELEKEVKHEFYDSGN